MKTPNIKKTDSAKLKGGFALVLALSLMGFMMLLIMTLAALVQMQLRLSQHSLLEQKAKQAAKFAAYQALSRVQSALGPDRRISANAKMFDGQLAEGIGRLETSALSNYNWWEEPMGITRADTNEIDSAIGQNRYWVGVWDARLGYSPDKIKREQQREEYVQKTVDQAITWLVSGNMVSNPDDLVKNGSSESVHYKPYTNLEKGQYVRAVSKGSASNDYGEMDNLTDVLVPLVTLEKDPNPVSGETETDKRQTRIAWWVSDEGQKASLNAVASYDDIQKAKSIDKFRLQTLPFYSGIHGLTLMNAEGRAGEKAFDFDMDDSEDDSSSLAIIRRLDDIRDLDVFKSSAIPSNISASKAFFHSATFGSKGLLVNVQQGGLKKDLTIGLSRKDFGNEPTTLNTSAQSSSGTTNMYFELPMGVAGYEYKQTAYPLWNSSDSNLVTYRRIPTDQNRMLKGVGHMFGPQMYGHEQLDDYETASAMTVLEEAYSDTNLWKDPGGPLWDQLRSYYNMRAPDDPSSNKLDARVQVDDRISFKPVVKRFQVFYVPTFVRYNSVSYTSKETPNGGHPYGGAGGEPYGVRLHIIPMLVLWNPYDVKIPGGTYYLINLTSRTPMGATRDHNPLGWYRFAIGYRSGAYFQCLRDLRTELMPSLDVEVLKMANKNVGTDETFNSGSTADRVMRGLYVPFRWWGSWDEELFRNANGTFLSYDAERAPKRKYSMSLKTFFNQIGAYPLGYGAVATPSTIQNQNNDSEAWKAFIYDTQASSNLYPSLEEVYNRKTLQKSNSTNMWSARVARVPLYLNNIPASVFHGKFDNKNSDNDLFKMQRALNLKNASSYRNSISRGSVTGMAQADSTLMDVGIRFLVKDTNGIEPGKAKVFAMKHIINYLGNGRGTTSNFYNGPNGDIEGTGSGTSPYERQEAMLYGIDDGGELGNGFFVDVVHPENEHYYRYNSRSWDTSDRRTPHILFDLGVIRAYASHLVDAQGNQPPTSIDEYLIDMDDQCGNNWNFIKGDTGIFTLGARPNSTPMGYGLYIRPPGTQTSTVGTIALTDSMGGEFYFFTYRNGAYYRYLDVDMWIWNREGMRLADNNPSSNAEYVRNTPKFFYARGMRVFLGEYMKSFPDPSVAYGTQNTISQIHTNAASRNFFLVGAVRNSQGSTTSLNPFDYNLSDSMYNRNDEYVYTEASTDGSVSVCNDPILERVAIKDESTGLLSPISEEARTRYYLNWLGLNAARHSANSWASYNGVFDQQIGDLAPAAAHPCYIVNSPTVFNYGRSLHSAIISNRDSVPYGFVFSLPYADNEIGSEPLFNRRLFVSGSVLASSFDFDLSTRGKNHGMVEPSDDPYTTLLAEFGRMNKSIQAISQVFGERNDGISENNIGYHISNLRDGDQHMIIGLRQSTGTSTAPIHHILREKEVVSNPANLASAHLTFLAGRSRFGFVSQQGLGNDKLNQSYGNDQPESLSVDFAIGNSLCPYRIVPERSYHITWLDGVSQFENGYTNQGEYYGIKYPYGSVDYNRESNASRGGSAPWVEDRNVLYDMSWNLNNILWDEYFFSTLPYRRDERDWIGTDYITPQNPRLKYYIADGALREEVCFKADTLGADTVKEYVENAAKFWIDGAFNVNSTDIDAWKAVLSTYRGTEVVPYSGASGSSDKENVPFHRFQAPYAGKEFTSGNSVDDEDRVMQGYRSLSPDEIEQLAAAIVEHVKDRGPFYSMAHFVNRLTANYSAEERFTDLYSTEQRLSLVPKMEQYDDRVYLESELRDDELTYKITHMQKGILQSAIDATEINAPFHRDPDLIIETGTGSRNMGEAFKSDSRYSGMRDPRYVWENWRAAVGPQATGAPTYLMQQDILSRLGSFLTVRSDTFKIRAYGEIRNPISGIVEAKAWCEMTVQRVPDYIDQSDENQTAYAIYDREFEIGNNSNKENPYSSSIPMDGFVNSDLSDLNKELGRRFKVVSFRWLNENEI